MKKIVALLLVLLLGLTLIVGCTGDKAPVDTPQEQQEELEKGQEAEEQTEEAEKDAEEEPVDEETEQK
ncbi:MAG: hypothetical protein KGZ96_04285 [Clostridia bacterium]|jgi:predicted small lipoprotein YifL|nr:hypothetical protein [Clostridia bacterium]